MKMIDDNTDDVTLNFAMSSSSKGGYKRSLTQVSKEVQPSAMRRKDCLIWYTVVS